MRQAKRFKSFFCRLCLFGGILAFYVWLVYQALTPDLPQPNHPILIYSNQCRHDLKQITNFAIDQAKRSVFVSIYALTDKSILAHLLKKASQGVEITLLYDPSASPNLQKKFKSLSARPVHCKGLMHRKILIIDDKMVFLGSANMTTSSLKMHDNLVIGMYHPELSAYLKKNLFNQNAPPFLFYLGNQMAEAYLLPDNNEVALDRLLGLIQEAKKSIYLSMFTLTHPKLTSALIEKHKEGVEVCLAVDYYTGQGASSKTLDHLRKQGLRVYLSQGQQLLHYKWAFIDGKTLIAGSTNWTKAAFTRNQDCFVILYELTNSQQKIVKEIWKIINLESI